MAIAVTAKTINLKEGFTQICLISTLFLPAWWFFPLEILAVKGINEALEGQDPQVTLRALQNPAAQLPQVMNNAGQLYHFEFRNIKAEKQVRMLCCHFTSWFQILDTFYSVSWYNDNWRLFLGPTGAWGNHGRSDGTHRTSKSQPSRRYRKQWICLSSFTGYLIFFVFLANVNKETHAELFCVFGWNFTFYCYFIVEPRCSHNEFGWGVPWQIYKVLGRKETGEENCESFSHMKIFIFFLLLKEICEFTFEVFAKLQFTNISHVLLL